VCISSRLSLFNIDRQAFTLFAPTNEAFANIPRELRARVDSFRGNIENPILRYHVSDRKVTSDTFQADQTIPTLYNGNRLRINKYSSGVSKPCKS
jgi:transforming growth factor-beta-induced protein